MTQRTADRLWTSPLLMGWSTLTARVLGNAVVLIVLSTRLSSAQIALWLTLLAANTLFLSADLGLNRLLTRMIAYGLGGARTEDLATPFVERAPPETANAANWDTIRHIYGQQQTLLALVAAGALAIIAIFGTWLIAPRVAALARPAEGWEAWCIVLVNGAIGLFGISYSSFLNGVDRVALVQRFELLLIVTAQLAALVVLECHGGLVALALAWMGPDMANVVVNRFLAHRIHGGRLGFPRWQRLDRNLAGMLWPQAWRTGLSSLSYQIAFTAAPLLLVRTADASRAAQFLFSLRMIKVIDGFAASPFTSYLPRLARLRFSGNARAFWSLAERGQSASLAVLLGVGLPAGFLAEAALSRIGSHAQFVPPRLFLLWLIGTAMMRFGFMHLQLVLLSNKVRHHVGYTVSGLMFVTTLALFRNAGPALDYGLALVAAATLFYVPYALVQSRPVFDAAARRIDIAIGAASLTVLVAAWAASALR